MITAEYCRHCTVLHTHKTPMKLWHTWVHTSAVVLKHDCSMHLTGYSPSKII